MGDCNRREALAVLGALVAGCALVPATARGAERSRFDPPTAACRLTRRVERGLSDGEAIIVTRSWDVHFAPLGRGFELRGTQAAVEVLAPAKLQALAQIEQGRVETGFLPLVLDVDGLMASGSVVPTTQSVQQAVEQASAMVERSRLEASGKEQARGFLRRMHGAAAEGINRLPRDLFMPQVLEYSDTRDVALADGQTGRIEIAFTASLDEAGGCLAQADRTLTTRLGELALVSREGWLLAPA